MKFTIPNMISGIRVLIAPVFLLLLLKQDDHSVQIACGLFLIGAVTDYLDGWYARKYEMVTALGRFFDPLADKVLTTAAYLGFVLLGIADLWMLIVIILRDMITTLLRVYADSVKQPIVTSFSAKTKTFLQMVYIIYILILYFIKSLEKQNDWAIVANRLLHSDSTYYIMLALTLFTIWTAIDYLYVNKNLLYGIIRNKK